MSGKLKKILSGLMSFVLVINLTFACGWSFSFAEENKYGFDADLKESYSGEVSDDIYLRSKFSSYMMCGLNYDDAWFKDNNPYLFDLNMAEFLLEASMAGFGIGGSNTSGNIDALFDRLGYTYIDNVKVYETLDSEDTIVYSDSTINFDYLDPDKDTIGYGIAYKNVDFGNGEVYTLVGVIVRGGYYGTEWASNFTIGNTINHYGFEQAALKVESRVLEYLQTIDTPYPVKMWVTGYSRGAATANFLGHMLNEDAVNNELSGVKPENIFTYTFETPMGVDSKTKTDSSYTYGNKAVVLDGNIFNVVNATDLVTKVAMDDLGYTRYGVDKVLPGNTTVSDYYNTEIYSNMINTYSDMFKKNPLTAYMADNVSEYAGQFNNQNEIVNCLTTALSLIFNNDRTEYADPSKTNAQNAVRLVLAGLESDKVLSNVTIHFSYKGLFSTQNKTLDLDLLDTDNISVVDAGVFALSFLNNRDSALAYSFDLSVVDEYTYDNKQTVTAYLTPEQFNVVWDMVPSEIKDNLVNMLLNNEFDEYEDFFKNLFSSIAFAHYPELQLSWLSGNDEVELFKNARYNQVIVNAPADVEVFYKGNLVAKIAYNETSDLKYVNPYSIERFVDDNGNKVVNIPDDKDYTVKITLKSAASSGNGIHVDSMNMNTAKYKIKTLDYDLSSAASGTVYSLSMDKDGESFTKNGSAEKITVWKDERGDLTDVTININCDTSMGSATGAGRYTLYDTVKLSTSPKTGYKFLGWYDENDNLVSSEAEFDYVARQNITLTAKYEIITCTITYNLDGGTNNVANPSTYTVKDSKITLGTPTKEYHRFDGWFTDAEYKTAVTEIDTQDPKDVSLYAKFTYVENALSIIYDSSMGTVTGADNYKYNTYAYVTASPKEGHIFLGWYDSSDKLITKDAGHKLLMTEAVSLNAKFKYVGMIVNVSSLGVAAGSTVYVDGMPVKVNEDKTIYANPNASVLTTYKIANENSSDIHTQYPTGMSVYFLSYNGSTKGSCSYVKDLDNVLTYAGTSIRVSGNKGIRAISSIPTATKNKLLGSGINGYIAVEYGTIMCWAKDLKEGEDLVLKANASGTFTASYGTKGRAYSKADKINSVFKEANGVTQFTNTLVGKYTNAQCASDFAMRPYIILRPATAKDASQDIVIYGGTLYRSISYVAYQNRNAFTAKTDAYEYIWELIRAGYGSAYDKEYKGKR